MVVVGLGKRSAGFDEQENWNEGKENIRAAVAGLLALSVYRLKVLKGPFLKMVFLPFVCHCLYPYSAYMLTCNSSTSSVYMNMLTVPR